MTRPQCGRPGGEAAPRRRCSARGPAGGPEGWWAGGPAGGPAGWRRGDEDRPGRWQGGRAGWWAGGRAGRLADRAVAVDNVGAVVGDVGPGTGVGIVDHEPEVRACQRGWRPGDRRRSGWWRGRPRGEWRNGRLGKCRRPGGRPCRRPGGRACRPGGGRRRGDEDPECGWTGDRHGRWPGGRPGGRCTLAPRAERELPRGS